MDALKNIINGRQVASLLHESSTAISFGLLDLRTGAVSRVDISADMATLPDEALLSVQVREVHNRVDLAEWWQRGDVLTDGDVPRVLTRAEPEPTWMVTPDGQEIDLRAHEGGLF